MRACRAEGVGARSCPCGARGEVGHRRLGLAGGAVGLRDDAYREPARLGATDDPVLLSRVVVKAALRPEAVLEAHPVEARRHQPPARAAGRRHAAHRVEDDLRRRGIGQAAVRQRAIEARGLAKRPRGLAEGRELRAGLEAVTFVVPPLRSRTASIASLASVGEPSAAKSASAASLSEFAIAAWISDTSFAVREWSRATATAMAGLMVDQAWGAVTVPKVRIGPPARGATTRPSRMPVEPPMAEPRPLGTEAPWGPAAQALGGRPGTMWRCPRAVPSGVVDPGGGRLHHHRRRVPAATRAAGKGSERREWAVQGSNL